MGAQATVQQDARKEYDYGRRAKEYFQHCNLCGSESHVLIVDRDRYGFEASTYLCLGCGLGFMNPHLTAEEFGEFYARWYRPLCAAAERKSGSDMAVLMEGQLNYARRLHANVLSRFITPAHRTLLDIGGSTGVIASYLASHSRLQPVVLDPSAEELAQARAAGCEGIQALWETYEPGPEQYDVVLLCRTVDHLLDIASSLRKIRRVVREGGLFYVDMVDFLQRARGSNSVSRATKIDHVYYLTYEPMLEYLRSAGFEPLMVDASREQAIGFVCRPTEPREALPNPQYARELLERVRALPRYPAPKPVVRRPLWARVLRRVARSFL